MKKHITRWMKTLFCCSVFLSILTIPIPVHAEAVELNVEKSFGISNVVDWNGCRFWEEGTYTVLGLTDDTYRVRLTYYFQIDKYSALSRPIVPGSEPYSYQVAPVNASINGTYLDTFNYLGVHLTHGRHNLGSAETTVPRGKSIEYRLYDDAVSSDHQTALNIINHINIDFPVYKVDFMNGAGAPISKQNVIRYQNATNPGSPAITGYEFKGWDRGYSNVTSDLTVNATWNRLPPSLRIRETVYEKGQVVDRNTLIQNALADDIREGNIQRKVVVDSPIVNGGIVDTSREGTFDITYKVTNTDDVFGGGGKTVEKPGQIHIVDTGSHLEFEGTNANVYPRFISGNEMINGEIPLNGLTPYSVWRSDGSAGMNQALRNSLYNRTPLYTVDGVYGQ